MAGMYIIPAFCMKKGLINDRNNCYIVNSLNLAIERKYNNEYCNQIMNFKV